MIQPLWKTVWRFFKKLGIKPPYDPAIPLLGMYPKETKIEKNHVPQCSLQFAVVVSMAAVNGEGCICVTDTIHDLIFSHAEQPLAESPGKNIFPQFI